MVEADPDCWEFYNWSNGTDGARCVGDDAHLLELPGLGDAKHKLIACPGPKKPDKCYAFWNDLVTKQGASLIINLCSKVGNEERKECMQYWPREKEDGQLEFIDSGSKMIVMVHQKEQVTETLKIYDLIVTRKTSSSIEKNVRLIHFSGFEDCEPPEVHGFGIVIESLMRHYVS